MQAHFPLHMCCEIRQNAQKRSFHFEEKEIRMPTMQQKGVWIEEKRSEIQQRTDGNDDEQAGDRV